MQKIDIDNISIDNECCNMPRITYNLFDNSTRKRDVSLRPSGDDIIYGVTINISPWKKINRKRWSTYSHDKQREILARMEAKFRTNTPSCKLVEIHYEECPTENDFNNIHFHAMYIMPEIFKAELETYYYNLMSDPTNKNWRHLDVKVINNKEAWLQYIRKGVGQS